MLSKILFHPSIFSVLFIAFFLLNSFIFQSQPVGVILLALFMGVYGWEMGSLIAPQEHGPLRWWVGCLTLLSFILLIITGAYYLAFVPKELTQLLILLTPPILGILTKHHTHPSLFEQLHISWTERKHPIPRTVFFSVGLILFFGSVFIQILQTHPITDAVRSAYERLPESIFVLMTLLFLLLLALLARGRERIFSLICASFILFLFLSLVLLVFPLGYGFDSFIHQATEKHLAEFGTITPKPFYYIGQYALVLFAHHGFLLPIKTADAFLVPLLAALLLPTAWVGAALHITQKKRLSMLTLIGLFLLPLTSFIVTTPQALANLFTLFFILASVPYLFESERPRLWFCGLLAFATVAIHPIAGLPALLFFGLLLCDPQRAPTARKKITQWIFAGLVVITSIILPFSFLLHAFLNDQPLSINWSALNPIHLLTTFNLMVFFKSHFHPQLDFVYLYDRHAIFLIVLFALFGWWNYRNELSTRVRILFWMTLALASNYLILKTAIDFHFLIDYERLNYADRLVPLMLFFLSPLLILGISHLFINLRTRPLILKTGTLVLFCALVVSAFYLTYPRRDAYETSRGFNTSADDISAVYLIEEWAQGEPYLVLANQSVSAAAISELGFVYYGDLFFYPIPTGEPLYQTFLAMNEMPKREIAQTAINLVPMHGDVFTVFYVINAYWWDASRLIEIAKTSATDWRSVGNGSVYVFRYDFEKQ